MYVVPSILEKLKARRVCPHMVRPLPRNMQVAKRRLSSESSPGFSVPSAPAPNALDDTPDQ